VSLDAVTAITRDHRVMERLFEAARTDKDNRPAIVAEIKARLQAHSVAEEERVYTALAKADPDEKDEVHHGVEEHREAEELLAKVEAADPTSAAFDKALKDFVDAVKHHVEEEESEILPALKEAVNGTRLTELGAAFEERRVELVTGAGYEEGDLADKTKAELYEEAKAADIPGRSSMNKDELARALSE
jgi:hemerythrin superfamily protein